MMKCLVAIVGATATGKSRLGCYLAGQFQGEIVNADSRQIYKYMDIGTAKPGDEDRARVPHHLLDIVNPDESYSVALYQHSATSVINSLQVKNRLPILVGGSGQYIWSVVEGWQIPAVEPDMAFRREMLDRAEEGGTQALFRELQELDPQAASRMDPNNVRRVIRALEIFCKTGKKPSELQVKRGTDYPVLIIGLTAERDNLYKIIDDRVEKMIEIGFVDEVKRLINMGYSSHLPSMSSLGYREIAAYLENSLTLEQAVEKIKFETHRFARSQHAWFRQTDERICWFLVGDDIQDKIHYTIKTFLENVNQI